MHYRYQIRRDVKFTRSVIWHGMIFHYESLVSFGNTFEEVLDNAYIATTNDDGLPGPRIMVIDMSIPEADRWAKILEEEIAHLDKT